MHDMLMHAYRVKIRVHTAGTCSAGLLSFQHQVNDVKRSSLLNPESVVTY